MKDQATHKSTVLQSAESMMRERDGVRDPEKDAEREQRQREMMNQPDVQAQLRQMMEKQWEKWYHAENSGAGWKDATTGRKRCADGREMLEALLTEYERNDQRGKLPYQPDYAQMRKRLGLATGSEKPRHPN